MARRRALRIPALALAVVACAAAWAVFAPPELGGSTRYVVTQGSSMAPLLHAGDLALVRPTDDAGKGDVVLYEHPRLGAHVLHRVVRVDGGRYVLKGDNNDFLDEVRPTASELDGRLWVTLPRAGSALAWAREPLHAGTLVFVLAFFALGGGAALAATRRRPEDAGHVRPADATPGGQAEAAPLILAAGLAGLVAFALLAVVAHSRPATRAQTLPDAYAHVGTFSYGTAVEPSDVYPDGRVDAGEAAFVSLVPALDVELAYRLRADDPSRVRGTITLGAVLSDGAGWRREIPLAEPIGFVGTSARVAGRLDVESLSAILEEMKALTGSGTSTFSLRIAGDVAVRGSVDGEPIAGSFSPTLPLLLDAVSLRPDTTDEPSLTVRRAGALTTEVPASLALGGLRISVDDARTVSVLGLVLAALAAAVGAAAVWRGRTGGTPSQVASLFGDRLITISRPPTGEAARVTELGDAESLSRLAEHHDRIVLHWREGRDHVYEVDDRGTVFRYRLALGVEPSAPVAADDEDTAVLPPTKLPTRAATG
jgi:signal peptidase I